MKLALTFRFCNAFRLLVHHKTLNQYFKDQHISKYLAIKQKNHLKYLVGLAIEVEVPPVTGFRGQGAGLRSSGLVSILVKRA